VIDQFTFINNNINELRRSPQSLHGHQEQACGIEQLVFNVTKALNRSDTAVTEFWTNSSNIKSGCNAVKQT
jgi:hypothetical protein